MSDEKESDEKESDEKDDSASTEESPRETEESPRESDPPRKERVDEDGLPLDRAPTIDDVRSTSGVHGRYAMGCTILIVIVILAFWFIRAGIGG